MGKGHHHSLTELPEPVPENTQHLRMDWFPPSRGTGGGPAHSLPSREEGGGLPRQRAWPKGAAGTHLTHLLVEVLLQARNALERVDVETYTAAGVGNTQVSSGAQETHTKSQSHTYTLPRHKPGEGTEMRHMHPREGERGGRGREAGHGSAPLPPLPGLTCSIGKAALPADPRSSPQTPSGL